MDEFALIHRYFAELAPGSGDDVALGIGDDCALLRMPAGCELAVTVDTLAGGRHFPETTAPRDVGWKALAASLSDLAAMGAVPRWFVLALSLPAADDRWLRDFADGLRQLAVEQGVALVGGDTTRGALSLTVTAMGWVEAGGGLRRAGARVGDRVAVTGSLGDAALALSLLQQAFDLSADPNRQALRLRLDRPTPRVAAGRALAGLASAAIDISDGLAGDLGHVLQASGVGAEIDAAALPRSPAFDALAPAGDAALALQLHGGDDYELCVCVPPENLPAAHAALARLSLPLTVVGEITAQPGLRLRCATGVRSLPARGYDHFAV